MKKLILSGLAAGAIATSANAGMVIDITAGAGAWNAAPSGFVEYGTRLDLEQDLGLTDKQGLYYYVDVDHFLPLVPNFKIERQELQTDATKTLANISFGNQTFNASTKTTADLTQNDLSLYWGIPGLNLATAGIVDVGFGINLKQFDGYVSLEETLTGKKEKVALNFIVPMGYASVTVDPPMIPAKLFASYKVISYKDSGLRDFQAKAMINLPIPTPLIDWTLDIGYKEQTLKIDDSLSDDITTDIKFSGVMFGVSAKF